MTQTENDALYFPGVSFPGVMSGGANNIVPISRAGKSVSGVMTATAVGGAVRGIVVVPKTPIMAVPHGQTLLVGISQTTQNEVRTLATKNRSALTKQLGDAQRSIISSTMKCTESISLLKCVHTALDQAIKKTPQPLKDVLKAVSNAVGTPQGLQSVLTAACPIVENMLRLPYACTAIVEWVKKMIWEGDRASSGENEVRENAEKTNSEEQEEERCTEDRNIAPSLADALMGYQRVLSTDVEAKIGKTVHVKRLVICVQNG